MTHTSELATKIARNIYTRWYTDTAPTIQYVDGLTSDAFTDLMLDMEHTLDLIDNGIIPTALIPTFLNSDLLKMQCFIKFCLDHLASRPQYRNALKAVCAQYQNCVTVLFQIIDGHYSGATDIAIAESDKKTDLACCKELSDTFGGIFVKPCNIIQFPTGTRFQE